MTNENNNQEDVKSQLLEDKDIVNSNEETTDILKEKDEEFDDFDDYEISNENENINAVIPNNTGKLLILLIPIVVLVLTSGFFTFKFVKNSNSQNVTKEEIPMVEISENQNGQDDIGASFFNEESNNEEDKDMMNVKFNDNGEAAVVSQSDSAQNGAVATITDVLSTEQSEGTDDNSLQAEGTKNSVMVSWNAKSRQNPFKPPVIERTAGEKYEKFGDVQFEIVEPPTELVGDENLTKLLQTQISGILYDEESPSAIVRRI